MEHSPEFLAMAEAAKNRIKEVSPEEVGQLVAKGAVVIDVRDAHEYENGHIEGALNISRGTLEMHITEAVPDKDAPVMLLRRWQPGSTRHRYTEADRLQKHGVHLRRPHRLPGRR